jgi:hypothetical protein
MIVLTASTARGAPSDHCHPQLTGLRKSPKSRLMFDARLFGLRCRRPSAAELRNSRQASLQRRIDQRGLRLVGGALGIEQHEKLIEPLAIALFGQLHAVRGTRIDSTLRLQLPLQCRSGDKLVGDFRNAVCIASSYSAIPMSLRTIATSSCARFCLALKIGSSICGANIQLRLAPLNGQTRSG